MMKAKRLYPVVECIQYKHDNLLEVLNFCNQNRKIAYINRHNEQLYIELNKHKILIRDNMFIVKENQTGMLVYDPIDFYKNYEILD